MFYLQEIPKASDLATNFGVIGAIVFVVCFLGWLYFRSQPKEKSDAGREPLTGETRPEYWVEFFKEINTRLEVIHGMLHDFMLVRNRDFQKVNEDQASMRKSMHDIRDAVADLDSAIQLLREQWKK